MKKILVLVLISLVLIQSSFVLALEADGSVDDGSVTDGSVIDESVYINLNYEGQVENSTVVSHVNFMTAQKTLEIPLMNDDIVNLTGQSILSKENEILKIKAEKAISDFYYESPMTGELPFDYKFIYKLDGSVVKAEELAGKTGNIEIEIQVTSNEDSLEFYRENFMSQMTVSLNLDLVSNIQVEDATQVVTGKSSKLNFITFPNTEAQYKILFYGQNFEMESIMISLMPSSMSLPKDFENQLDGMTRGFDDMYFAIGEMKNASVTLQDGLYELSGGLNTLSSNVNVFNGQSKTMINGLDQILKGYTGVSDGLGTLTESSSEINTALLALDGQGKELSAGLNLASQGLDGLSNSSDGLLELAQSMLTHSDPLVVEMAKGIIAKEEGMKTLSDKISYIDNGLNSYVEGMNVMKNQYDLFDTGLNDLSTAMSVLRNNQVVIENKLPDYNDGLALIAMNLELIADSSGEIPGQLNKMIEGQSELQEGLNTANDGMKEAVSGFSSDVDLIPSILHGQPVESLQIFIKSPSIIYEEVVEEYVEVKKKESFFDRLFNLFK